jgi:hypothetical protein
MTGDLKELSFKKGNYGYSSSIKEFKCSCVEICGLGCSEEERNSRDDFAGHVKCRPLLQL